MSELPQTPDRSDCVTEGDALLRAPRADLAALLAAKTPALDGHGALVAASRCLYCYDAPCVEACPTGIDIPAFIGRIRTGDLKGAAEKILSANPLGASCARVCPTEILCEQACVRTDAGEEPVPIGALQRHATDPFVLSGTPLFERKDESGHHVAVVGGGPAGLAAAHRLALAGHGVTLFEAGSALGGLNETGIAPYKLTSAEAAAEGDWLLSVGGITVQTSAALGREITLAELMRDFDAVFLGIGLARTHALRIPGERMAGVTDAVRWIASLRAALARDEAPAVPRRIVVVGGGNTAVDAAVEARRLGAAEVTILYRRGPDEMSATAEEQAFALKNGVGILHWARPVRVIGRNGGVVGLEIERTTLNPEGRLIGTGETRKLAVDAVFKAIGQKLDRSALHDGDGNELPIAHGRIVVDDFGATAFPAVFAGGDCVAGEDLTVQAVADGMRAADAIDRYLHGRLPRARFVEEAALAEAAAEAGETVIIAESLSVEVIGEFVPDAGVDAAEPVIEAEPVVDAAPVAEPAVADEAVDADATEVVAEAADPAMADEPAAAEVPEAVSEAAADLPGDADAAPPEPENAAPGPEEAAPEMVAASDAEPAAAPEEASAGPVVSSGEEGAPDPDHRAPDAA